MRIIIALLLFTFISCDRDIYVECIAKFEKKADDCSAVSAGIKMISNFGGERFEFEKCLPVDETLRTVKAERKGDTVLIRFAKAGSGQASANFAVIMDIDSYPEYQFVTIDDLTFQIGEAEY